MLILAEPQEIFCADLPGQIQPLRAQPNPLPGDALTFLVAVGLCGLMTLAGSLLPAVRAVRVDPVAVMRTE